MSTMRVSDGGNRDVYLRVRGAGSTADPYSLDYVPDYEPTKVLSLANSGTVIAGSAGHSIVIEYHTQQNLGTVDLTLTPKNGTVPLNENKLPYTAGQNFFAFVTPAPGREWRLDVNTPFVLTFSAAGSVLTNTRYWYEAE